LASRPFSLHPDGMSSQPSALSDSRLANLGARVVAEAYDGFETRFRIVTRRARIRFAERDWTGMSTDARERLDLYERAAEGAADNIRSIFAERTEDEMVWAGMKAVYSGLIMDRHDWELAETFFNSVTRKIFTTVGVDPRIEFVDTDFDTPPSESTVPLHRSYESMPIPDLIASILRDANLSGEFAGLGDGVALAAEKISDHMTAIGAVRVAES